MQAASIHQFDATLERWVDRLNPVLVKEARQVLKSRGFAGSFLVMLGLTYLASLMLVADAGTRLEFSEPGATFLAVYVSVLMIALCFVVPITLFRSVVSEFDHRTFESLAITTLSPQRIVLGKLQCALVQMAVYYSAVAPFVCFTYLLGGVSLPGLLLALIVSALASLAISLGSLMLGSLARSGPAQVAAQLVLFAGAFVVFVFGTMFAVSIVGWGAELDPATLLGGFACVGYCALFYVLMTLGVSFSQLTPTRPRPIASVAPQPSRPDTSAPAAKAGGVPDPEPETSL